MTETVIKVTEGFWPLAQVGILPHQNSDYLVLVVMPNEPKGCEPLRYQISLGAADGLFDELQALRHQSTEPLVEALEIAVGILNDSGGYEDVPAYQLVMGILAKHKGEA